MASRAGGRRPDRPWGRIPRSQRREPPPRPALSGRTSYFAGALWPRPPRLSQRPEGRPHLLGEDLGLLPGGEVAAPRDPVVVDQVGIGLLRPALRRRIELVGEDGHADRELHALDVEERQMALP